VPTRTAWIQPRRHNRDNRHRTAPLHPAIAHRDAKFHLLAGLRADERGGIPRRVRLPMHPFGLWHSGTTKRGSLNHRCGGSVGLALRTPQSPPTSRLTRLCVNRRAPEGGAKLPTAAAISKWIRSAWGKLRGSWDLL